MNAGGLLVAGLIIAVLGSAVAVVLIKHDSRKMFVELQELERTRDALNVEWGQLQLEQGTWATHNRIESLATSKLNLLIPSADAIVLVTP